MRGEQFDGMYEIDDGYAGGHRPRYFTVFPDDLEDDMTDAQLEDLYTECAATAFRDIGFSVERLNDFMMWAREQLQKRQQEED